LNTRIAKPFRIERLAKSRCRALAVPDEGRGTRA
jgi:hypothetical protein